MSSQRIALLRGIVKSLLVTEEMTVADADLYIQSLIVFSFVSVRKQIRTGTSKGIN